MTRPRPNSRSALGAGSDCRFSCSTTTTCLQGRARPEGPLHSPGEGTAPRALLLTSASVSLDSTPFACGCSCFPEGGMGVSFRFPSYYC